MKLTKAQRATLREMFGGRCAYCGCELGDRWHADHIEAVERKLEYVREGYSSRLRTTGEVHRPERDCIENLNPSCAPCNIDKHAMTLEQWRTKLQNAVGVLTRNQPTFRHAMRFGLVQDTGAKVEFYFERAAASTSQEKEGAKGS
jgi:hypothetical protein